MSVGPLWVVCLSGCVHASIGGASALCGTRGCWHACTCSVAPLCGNVCARACERGRAHDGRPWVCLGGRG